MTAETSQAAPEPDPEHDGVPDYVLPLNPREVARHRVMAESARTAPQLAGWLRDAGLEVLEFRGRSQIVPAPPGLRPPAWTSRQAMLDAGVVTTADLDRWDRAIADLDASPDRPTFFMPLFTALGRTPG